jgi:hypothetical protein
MRHLCRFDGVEVKVVEVPEDQKSAPTFLRMIASSVSLWCRALAPLLSLPCSNLRCEEGWHERGRTRLVAALNRMGTHATVMWYISHSTLEYCIELQCYSEECLLHTGSTRISNALPPAQNTIRPTKVFPPNPRPMTISKRRFSANNT